MVQGPGGNLTIREGLDRKGDKLYIPNTLQLQILQWSHDTKQANHFGFLKTLHLVRRWLGMKRDIDMSRAARCVQQ